MNIKCFKIKIAFANFTNQHKDGKMNKASFTKMLEQALPGKESKKMVPHIFRVYDDNKDGYIDFSEFMESVYFIFGSERSPRNSNVCLSVCLSFCHSVCLSALCFQKGS